MSRKRRFLRYLAVVDPGPHPEFYRLVDFPNFTLSVSDALNTESRLAALRRLKAHIAELEALGLPVPAPTDIRDFMAVPGNRRPHLVFDLGELETLESIANDFKVLDELDRKTFHRYIQAFGEIYLVRDIEFERVPSVSKLMEIFGLTVNEFYTQGAFPIDQRQAVALAEFLTEPLDLETYNYFLVSDERD